MKSGRIRAIGIDLGTTNSAVTEIVWEPGSGFSSGVGAGQIVPPTICTLEIEQPTREGVFTSPLVPSVVAILPDGTIWVGEGAKRLRAFPAHKASSSRIASSTIRRARWGSAEPSLMKRWVLHEFNNRRLRWAF